MSGWNTFVRRRMRPERHSPLRQLHQRLHRTASRKRAGMRRRPMLVRFVRRKLGQLQRERCRRVRNGPQPDEELRRLRNGLLRRDAALRALRRGLGVHVGLPRGDADALQRLLRRSDEQRRQLRNLRKCVHDEHRPRPSGLLRRTMHVGVQHGLQRVQRGVRRRTDRREQLRGLRSGPRVSGRNDVSGGELRVPRWDARLQRQLREQHRAQ